MVTKDHHTKETIKTPFVKKLRMLFNGSAKASQREHVEIAVCQLLGRNVSIVHLKRKNGEIVARSVLTPSSSEASAFLKKCGKKCPVVALLHKSAYLIKAIEIPHVLPSEVETMLNLETEASLPSEFGQANVSHRDVPAKKEGFRRYEVYISRSGVLESYVERLTTIGCPIDMIIPSAIAWKGMLAEADRLSMLAVNSSRASQLEITFAGDDKCLSVRTIKNPRSPDGPSNYEHGLTECIRSLLSQTTPESCPLTVGWVGENCPFHLCSDVVTFEEIDSPDMIRLSDMNSEMDIEDSTLPAAAYTLLNNCPADILKTCNLMPSSILSTRTRRTINKNIGIAMAGIIIGMLLSYVSLKVAIHRYKNIMEEINGKISLIEKEGEGVGQRIEQLEAMRAAKVTGNDLTDILSGLYVATPDGASYSNVELGEAGRVRLRGQAKSLALPFLLPQELEQQSMFTKVVLKDAGQVKKSGGTITEFRIECTLKRRNNR